MTSHQPEGWPRGAIGMTGLAVAMVAGVVLLPSTQPPMALLGLVVLVAGSLLLEVELPWGGTVLLGHAVVIAFAGRFGVTDFLTVVGLALAVVALPQFLRYGLRRCATVLGVLVACAAAGLAGRAAGNALAGSFYVDHRTAVLAPIVLAGVAYLSVLAGLQLVVSFVGTRPRAWHSALSMYVSLVCAAALLGVASERSPALGAVALVPLLVLRFSFQRYFEARRTYLQTTQALSLIPEVAGLIPLGHGERTSVYASALAKLQAMTPEDVDRVATVARLHHIGRIAHPDLPDRPYGPSPEDGRLVGQAGAEILAGTGFLQDIAPLVAGVQAAEPNQLCAVEAIVRVASTLDDLVGQDPGRLSDAIVGLLARHELGVERTMALTLAQLCDAQPSLADRACAAGAAITTSGAEITAALAAGDR